MRRAALFLDFENIYNALRRRTPEARRHPYGLPPKIRFDRLVHYVERHYGLLAPEDFIVVANFSHYNAQLGGLNRVATLVDAQSFFHPHARRRRQPSPGKKWVIRNYADMRLAFEIGRHVSTRPADVYIIGSGDESFTAVARALQQQGHEVVFLVADASLLPPESNLRAEFSLFDFISAQALVEESEEEDAQVPLQIDERERALRQLLELVSRLRQTLQCGVPLLLAQALWNGSCPWEETLNLARGRGCIDLWQDPEHGMTCISRREERLYGRVHPIPVRTDVAKTARVFHALSQMHPPAQVDRVFWRRHLRETLHLNARQAKALLRVLLDLGILRDGRMQTPVLTWETALALARYLRHSPNLW